MIFSSLTFLIFFVIVAALVWSTKLPVLARRVSAERLRRARHGMLFAASYIFYGWWDWRFCALMLALSVLACVCGRQIERNRSARVFLAIGVVAPLAALGFFKYCNFFLDSMGALLGTDNLGTLNIILPVGISFYTFQSMSYVVDVSRKKVSSAGFLDVALYIAFFPQLMAGPIVKAADFLPQLSQDRNISLDNLAQGIQIFLFGLAKKVVFADRLSVFVDDVFTYPVAFHSGTVILAVLAYSMQIYFDFSGYSDMAVGSAKCLGYDLQRNFNLPYVSQNPTEFWKRWHISLSSWLKEYLYIPLGGNRKGRARTYINLMLTMLLGGLWHGASWNFVLWGALHGAALAVHKLFARRRDVKKHGIPFMLSVLATFVFVSLCWIFFRADSWDIALLVLQKTLWWTPGIVKVHPWAIASLLALLAATIAAWARSRNLPSIQGFYPVMNLARFGPLFLLFLAIGLIAGLAYTGGSPFIYFQF